MTSEVPQPAQVYLQLRDHILSLTPAEVGLQPTPALPHVWCVMMETGYPVGWATLIALADGTTSLNFSTGGGMLGSGDYIPVAEASRAFVVEAERRLLPFPGHDDASKRLRVRMAVSRPTARHEKGRAVELGEKVGRQIRHAAVMRELERIDGILLLRAQTLE